MAGRLTVSHLRASIKTKTNTKHNSPLGEIALRIHRSCNRTAGIGSATMDDGFEATIGNGAWGHFHSHSLVLRPHRLTLSGIPRLMLRVGHTLLALALAIR